MGVIGLGMGVNTFLLHDDPNSRFEVRGLCSANEAKAQAIARQHGVAFATDDYRQLVGRDDLDLIAIYSPDHLHAQHCIAALEAGKHVVCTKPMIGRARGEGVMEELERIVGLVRVKRVKFLVGQTMRFDPEFKACKRLYDDEALGKAIVALAHYVHDFRNVAMYTPWRVQAPQDLLFGGACHPVDVLRWIFGDVEEVHCYATAAAITEGWPADLEDSFLINMKFTSGLIAHVTAAYGVCHPPLPMMGLKILGSKGSVAADYTDFKGGHVQLVLDKIRGVPGALPGDMGDLPVLETAMPAVTLGAYGHGKAVIQYMRQMEDAIVNDTQPSPDALEGARCISTCLAAWESIRTGKAVKVRNEF